MFNENKPNKQTNKQNLAHGNGNLMKIIAQDKSEFK